MQTNLWNRNFILCISGMFLSALGGIGLNIAMGVLVFSETQSTFMAAVFTAVSFIPSLLIPFVAGPMIDRRNPLKVLLKNEGLLAFVFFAAAMITNLGGFNYMLYLILTLIMSSLGAVSELTSHSMIPQLMTKQNYSRGNAIISVIYPLCSIIVTPIAIVLFKRYGIDFIFLMYGVLTVLDIFLESKIKMDFEYIESNETFKETIKGDLVDGAKYLHQDKAVLNVFLCFVFAMIAYGSSTLIYPFFHQSSVLNDDLYALMISVQSFGYLVGGLLHYFIVIPDSKRYKIAVYVYFVFIIGDSIFFFLPFWGMCFSRFLLGVLGMNSANIRVSAIQSRVPACYRAKVNGFFSILMALSQMFGQVLAGFLGEWMNYAILHVAFQMLYLFGVFYFILPKDRGVKELYNYPTKVCNKDT